MAPHARFRIYHGTSDSDPLVYEHGADPSFEVVAPYPYYVLLDQVDLDGGTYGSWLVDLKGDGSGPYPGDNSVTDGSSGSGTIPSGDGTYLPVLHFFQSIDDGGPETFPILAPGAGEDPLPGVGECPSFTLESPRAAVIFDCSTPDDSASGLVWVWEDIDGWWEPPPPDIDTIGGLGHPVVAVPTAARWQPRTITLTGTAVLGPDGLLDALDTLTALCDMLRVPGTLTSAGEPIPKTIPVRLADRPSYEILGAATYLKVTIPMIAHRPLRSVVADDTLVV